MASASDNQLLEAFKLFDTDGDQLISASELATVMRGFGYNPTALEVRELINNSEGAGESTARGGLIDFPLFVRLMRKKARSDDQETELKDAFRVLDKEGQGWIDTMQMQQIVKALGEDLSEEEVKAMISEAISNYEGKVYYDGFVKTMIANS